MNAPDFSPIHAFDQATAALKSMAFSSCPSSDELMHTAAHLGSNLRQRLREVRLDPETQTFLISFPNPLHFVALVSEEDPDTLATLPVWTRLCQSSPRFELRVLLDTDDLSGLGCLLDVSDMNAFLDEADLPQVFIFDEDWALQSQWGPRPQAVEPYLDQWFAENSEYERLADSDLPVDQQRFAALNEQLIQQMRVWYNSGINQICVQEVRALLADLREENGDENGEEDSE